MTWTLSTAHRLAQTNYPIRVGSFGYSFVVIVAMLMERGRPISVATLALPALAMLLYPHLAYLWTRVAADSKRAELDMLLVDGVLLGMAVGQTGLALWLSGALVIAVSLNNGVCGGSRRLVIALLLMSGSALTGALLTGAGFHPDTGPLVTLLCFAGIAAYVSAVGLVMHGQTERLVRMRNALSRSEDQFRFIAEHAGDYVMVVDSRGRMRYASGGCQERFDPNALRDGAHWTGLVQPADRERARHYLESVLKSSRGARLALGFTPLDGTPLELECAANPIERHGEVTDALVVITARPRSGLEQSMEGAFSRQLSQHHARYGLLVTSTFGRIEGASPRMGEILACTPQELLGKSIGEISEAIPASDSLLDDVWRALDADGICQRKFLAIERNGKLKLAWANVVQLRSEDGTPRYAWTIVDDPALTVAQEREARESDADERLPPQGQDRRPPEQDA